MIRNYNKFRAGDWVVVKSPREIAQTLDAEGTLDGLPFMPEMLQFCGRFVRVTRPAEKTCVEYPGGKYKIREFRKNDVVILEVPRCSGAGHDGCQRLCVLFWKTAWMRRVEGGQPVTSVDQSGQEELRAVLKTRTEPGRYFCQSTQLEKATTPLPRARVVLKCFSEVLSGSRGLSEMARLVLHPLWAYATWWFPRPVRAGNLKRTPVSNLNLQPGEWVNIKSETEVVQTLDRRARNRGLICDGGMRQFCGGKYQVKSRLDRMISEPTGEMRQVEGTVMLEGLNCLCWYNHVGGCPRDDLMYWREAWLERIGGAPQIGGAPENAKRIGEKPGLNASEALPKNAESRQGRRNASVGVEAGQV